MSKFIVGVDVGGTSVKIGTFDLNGKIIEKWEIPTVGKTVLPDVAASIKAHFNEEHPEADCTGIGIDVPGPVKDGGIVLECVNLGWAMTDVKGKMEELTGIKTLVVNDANAAALGEAWQGGGMDSDSMVMITLGTGVGGGVIVDGKVVEGSTGAGGEIGHILVEPAETVNCNCGKKGCLEQYASATGIVRLAKKGLATGKYTSLLSDIDDFSAKDVLDAAKKSDPLGEWVLDRAGYYLAIACSHIAQTIDPAVFVIGGGVSKAGPVLLTAITKYYDSFVMNSLRGKEFRLASLGNDAGIYGAAALWVRK